MEHFPLKKATVEKWQNKLADHFFELSESDLNMKRNKTLATDKSQYITQPALPCVVKVVVVLLEGTGAEEGDLFSEDKI